MEGPGLEAKLRATQEENIALLQRLYTLNEALEQERAANLAHAMPVAQTPQSEVPPWMEQQLMQVQEELLRAQLAVKEARANAERAEASLTRLFKCNPDLVGWAEVELQVQKDAMRLIFSDVLISGQRKAQALIGGIREHDRGTFLRVELQEDKNFPVIVMPDGSLLDDKGDIVILPTTAHASLRGLLTAASRELIHRQLDGQTAWSREIDQAAKAMASRQNHVTWENIELRHVQINPDYEHLWFVLRNLRFGHREWPVFEFRLGAANILKSGFSDRPKLEFPSQAPSPQQLEKWYEESEDDFGPKFELRFDLRRNTFDAAVWSELSRLDQRLIAAILTQLPDWILEHAVKNPMIKRSPNAWGDLATRSARIVARHDMAMGSGDLLF